MNTNSYIVMVLYDIPVTSYTQRKKYVYFRNKLLEQGYYKLQESIYVCKYSYREIIERDVGILKKFIPKNSNIRILILTKTQFNNMKVLSGDKSFFEKILTEEKLILEL